MRMLNFTLLIACFPACLIGWLPCLPCLLPTCAIACLLLACLVAMMFMIKIVIVIETVVMLMRMPMILPCAFAFCVLLKLSAGLWLDMMIVMFMHMTVFMIMRMRMLIMIIACLLSSLLDWLVAWLPACLPCLLPTCTVAWLMLAHLLPARLKLAPVIVMMIIMIVNGGDTIIIIIARTKIIIVNADGCIMVNMCENYNLIQHWDQSSSSKFVRFYLSSWGDDRCAWRRNKWASARLPDCACQIGARLCVVAQKLLYRQSLQNIFSSVNRLL